MGRNFIGRVAGLGGASAVLAVLTACSGTPTLPPAEPTVARLGPEYVIGPLDNLNIFVWRQPELTETVPVRPDGRISVPLIEDLPAAGRTSTQLARDIETKLKKFVQDPVVTVIVTSFTGPFDQQVREIGRASCRVRV